MPSPKIRFYTVYTRSGFDEKTNVQAKKDKTRVWRSLSMPRKKLRLSPGMEAKRKETGVPAVLRARGRGYARRGLPLG